MQADIPARVEVIEKDFYTHRVTLWPSPGT